MPGETPHNPPPNEQAFLTAAAAEVLAADGLNAGYKINAEYQQFVRAAETNEAPFTLTKTQRWAAVGGCILFLSWGVNAMIEADDAPRPLDQTVSPTTHTRPGAPATSPSQAPHGPISGKGGAPNFKNFNGGE